MGLGALIVVPFSQQGHLRAGAGMNVEQEVHFPPMPRPGRMEPAPGQRAVHQGAASEPEGE